jgi:hypothetical protein
MPNGRRGAVVSQWDTTRGGGRLPGAERRATRAAVTRSGWWPGWIGVVALLLAGCSGRARPTYEYGPTETYTSTAIDPTPRLAPSDPAAGGSDAPRSSVAGPAASDQPLERPVTATETTAPASGPASAPPPEEPAAPPVEPGRWYKAKRW